MASPDVNNNNEAPLPTMPMQNEDSLGGDLSMITRPFLVGITAPTEEEWEMLFEDARRSNAKQVVANNPSISYSTFCSRMARWDKGERGPATKAISARGRRGRPRNSANFRTPSTKRSRHSSSEDDEEDENGENERRRQSASQAGSPLTLEQSSRSAFHPFGAPVGSSPFAMGQHVNLTASAVKPSVLTCLTEVEAQLVNEIKAAARTMRETGGWLAKSNTLIDQMETTEIANLHEEVEAARAAVEALRKARGES